ncbi:FAD-dependent oxidoreductase [Herbiconiux solani]|uniref:FAD-dependent oxidoreductase n=1 Tax=Herbiconiux solani TaxID=661329 RepID=UPI0014717343|nr:NAD(P)/FAD-dependent oxidoreductase [Herbiconiux solani]
MPEPGSLPRRGREAWRAGVSGAAVSGVTGADVAVVGAGPVGVFLATALALRGLDVVLLERRVGERRHSRAIGIHPPSLAALERLGVLDEILRRGMRVDRGVLRIDGQDAAALEFARVPERHPFVITLPQVETERILRARLDALAPGALREGFTVGRIEALPGRVRLHAVAGPSAVDARLVVGADGPLGVVRRAAGLGGTSRAYRHRYVMGDVADETDDGATAVLHLNPDGIVESFPLPGGVRRWVTHLPEQHEQHGTCGSSHRRAAEDDDGARAAARLADLVDARTGIRIDPATTTMTSEFGVRRAAASGMARGRMLLVGDAAHEVSPIGGQGMNLGWLDADELAEIVPEVLRSGRREPLVAWQRRRLASAARAARMAEFNMAMGSPCGPLAFAARRLVVAGASGPLLAGRLARAFTMHGL